MDLSPRLADALSDGYDFVDVYRDERGVYRVAYYLAPADEVPTIRDTFTPRQAELILGEVA